MRKYWALYRIGLQNTLVYRGPMLFWLLGNILGLITIISVWFSTDNTGQIATYSQKELITYYIVAMTLWWINGWAPFWVRNEIKDGSIVGNTLSKPLSFYKRVFSSEAAWHSISSFVGLAASLIFVAVLRDYFIFSFSFVDGVVILLSIVLSILIINTFCLCLTMLGFWFTETNAIEAVFWGGLTFLGGYILPLSFFPPAVITILELSPFRYMSSFSLELYFHKLSLSQTLFGFMMQILWVAILFGIYKVMWARGTRVYSSWGQ